MQTKIVILVHGMGTHAVGETRSAFTKALLDRASACGVDISSRLEEVEVVEFNYSGYFDAIRTQFSDNATARAQGFGYLSGSGFDEKLITQLNDFEVNMGKDEFFYTHWLDVILYGTLYFGEKVRRDFIEFFERIRKEHGHQNIHIVCHSLGTAVVHDSLAKFYRAESNPFDDIPDVSLGNFNVASIWTIANVSRLVNLLNGLADPHHSTVKTGADGCTSSFLNVLNEYDPFTWFKRYNRQMTGGVTFSSSAIRQANMHDLYEYITEPKVFRAIAFSVYNVTVSENQYGRGVRDYNSRDISSQVTVLKSLLDDLKSDPDIHSLQGVVKKFKQVFELIDGLKDDLETIDA